MLMHNKLEPDIIMKDLKLDLMPVCALPMAQSEVGDDVNTKQKQLWEVIVRMHYLSHELRDLDLESGIPPAFTRLVSGLLSEWAVMAEEAAAVQEPGPGAAYGRGDHH